MLQKFHFISDLPSLACLPFVTIGHLLKSSMKHTERSKNINKYQQILFCCFSLLSVSSIANSSVITNSDTITFKNFSESIVLHKIFAQQYIIEGSEQKVTLANRLIVKTSQTKSHLFQFHPEISQVTELFQGTTFNYFSLTLTSEAYLAEVLTTLQKLDVVELVQPDLLQLQPTAEQFGTAIPNTSLTAAKKKKNKLNG